MTAPADKSRAAVKARSARLKHQNAIRVLVICDQPIVRQGVIHCLAGQEHLVVVGEAENGREALAKAKQLSPDVVVMDMEFPGPGFLTGAKVLREENPDIKLVILLMNIEPECLEQIIQSGAQGCLSKKASPQQLVQAIEAVAAGRSFISPDIAQCDVRQFMGPEASEALSPRQIQVLAGIAEGLTNKEIASLLGKSVRTIEMHRARLMRKLNIHNAAGLTKFAVAKGLALPRSGAPANQNGPE